MKSMFKSVIVAVSCIFLPVVIATSVFAQVAPKSPVYVAVNGVFVLCPQLVRGGGTPTAPDLAKLGFESAASKKPTELLFNALGDQGMLITSFDEQTKKCLVSYSGGGYESISGAVRAITVQNKFTRLTGGDMDSAKADVFEGTAPGSSQTARIIIVSNRSNNTSSIEYSER